MDAESNPTKASAEKRNSEKTYRVQTKDNEICEVPASVLGMSKLITTMLEDLNLQDDDTPIPIPNVNANVFKKVVLWCEKHMYVDDESNLPYILEQWDDEFFNIDHPMLFEIITAANYLDIPTLLDDGCKRVAQKMRGKTPEEIRKMFNIVNDFTPEEEEEIRRENAWCEE
ncbi:Skp1 family, dimerization domain protein [Dictyocaulus viviparus]|uniref:Skp1-related protein n=1 Tax=Dictyocaulus viviparus TaxID=29172 RepID=A0A0D8XK18_DICVI|nr:Skp1 family, dimerization domain protein [Dictyocaulus viviparus]